MDTAFARAFRCERLKKKRSLADWLIISGGFFTPAIIIIARLVNYDRLQTTYSSDAFWTQHWRICWESMAIFFLPMGAILTSSLITQIEYKNNAWKQVHTLPLSVTTVYFSKFAVMLLMMLQFFVLFNVGIFLAALAPWLVVPGTPYPTAPFGLWRALQENGLYFIDCLPIVALQYMISLRFKNFLIPIGVGFLIWITSLGSLSWKYAYVIPYSYCMLNFLKDNPGGRVVIPDLNFHLLAVGYFGLFLAVGYYVFLTRSEKG